MTPLNPIAPVALHSLLAGTKKRKPALATCVKYHIGEGRVRAASSKSICRLAKIMADSGASMPATQDVPQQAPNRARTHEPCAPA